MSFCLNNFIILFIVLIVSKNVSTHVEKYITVWEHPNSQGVSENLCVSHCSNVRNPKNIKLVSSINLQGNCARFYDDFNCTGKSTEVLPNSASLNHMVAWNLDDRIRSVGPCRNECAIEVTGNFPEEDFKVQLFSKANYLGNDGNLIGPGCLSVRNNFVDQVKSIKTFGQCIQLYNNSKCINSGENAMSVELRPDTYFHSDFAKWNFPKVGSISHCRYKCDGVPVQSTVEEVTIFDQVNYGGSWIKANLDKCINLPYQWETGAKSLELSTGTCVAIYKEFDCEGEPIRIEASASNSLSTHEKLSVLSIRACPKQQDNSSSNAVTYINVGVFIIIVVVVAVGLFFVKRYVLIKQANIPECDNGTTVHANVEKCKKDEFGKNLVDLSL